MSNGKNNAVLKTFIAVVAVLFVLLAVAGVAAYFTDWFTEKPNDGSLVQDGMEMDSEVTMRFESPQGIRFTANISTELANEVASDPNKSFGAMLAPLDYFEGMDTGEAFEEQDWMKIFEEHEAKPMLFENVSVFGVTSSDGALLGYKVNFVLTNVLYANTNRPFFCIGFVKTTDGENVSYTYASLPKDTAYRDMAVSYASLAAKCLNEEKVSGTYYSAEDLALLNKIVNDSVDLANGLEAATDDGSQYTVTLSETEKTMKIGEKFTLTAEIAEEVGLPVWWQSSDYDVATVNNGEVTAVGDGTAKISAFVAGQEYVCTVTVGESVPEEYTVTFVADGETVGTQTYTAENTDITVPEVPEKKGYTGEWEEYVLDGGDKTVNAVYSVITYKIEYVNPKYSSTSKNYFIFDDESFIRNAGIENGNYPVSYTIESGDIEISDLRSHFYGLNNVGDFSFDGWYLDSDCSVPFDGVIPAGSTGDIVLYADMVHIGSGNY